MHFQPLMLPANNCKRKSLQPSNLRDESNLVLHDSISTWVAVLYDAILKTRMPAHTQYQALLLEDYW